MALDEIARQLEDRNRVLATGLALKSSGFTATTVRDRPSVCRFIRSGRHPDPVAPQHRGMVTPTGWVVARGHRPDAGSRPPGSGRGRSHAR